MKPRHGRNGTCLRAAVGAICTAAAGLAAAQASRDLANRPPSPYDRDHLGPMHVQLYGQLSIGWTQADARAGTSGRIGSRERSRIGLRATETLGRDWRAHMQLEHTLAVADGSLPRADSAFDARATVGLSTRDLGRIDLGRMEQAAATLLLRTDPWAGADAVGPGSRLHAPRTEADPRSSAVLGYTSPPEHPVRLVLQASRPRQATGAAAGHGAALSWDRLPWLLGTGLQRSRDGVRYVPVVLAHDNGVQRLTLAWTDGRGLADAAATPVGWRNLFIGFTRRDMAKGDPTRIEWRAGLNLHQVDGDTDGRLGSDMKVGAGVRYRLSRHVWTNLGAAWIHPRQGDKRWGLEATLTYSFQRDLRVPQGPR